MDFECDVWVKLKGGYIESCSLTGFASFCYKRPHIYFFYETGDALENYKKHVIIVHNDALPRCWPFYQFDCIEFWFYWKNSY